MSGPVAAALASDARVPSTRPRLSPSPPGSWQAASMLAVLRSVRVPASLGTGWGDLVGWCVPVGGEASVTQHRLAESVCPHHVPLQSPPTCRGPTAQGWKKEPSSLTAEAVCAHVWWLGHAPATLSSWEFGSGGVEKAACSWARRGPSPC